MTTQIVATTYPKVGDTFHAIAHVAGRPHPAGPFVCAAVDKYLVRSEVDGEGDDWKFFKDDYRFEIVKGVSR